MNKLFTKIAALALGAAMAFGVGVAVAKTKADNVSVHADDLSYTIVFKDSGGASDGTADKTALADLVSSGDSYVSSVTASKMYQAKSGYGVKGGSSSAKGSLLLNLSSSGQVKASKITLNMAMYDSGKTVKVTINGTSTTTVSPATSLTDYEVTVGGSLTSIKVESTNASKNRFYLNNIKVYTAATKTLSSIALDTTNVKTTFTTGDTFTSAGLVTTAYYSDDTHNTVTPTSISSPSMSSAGQKTVTVSYTEGGVTKTASYYIQVNDPRTVSGLTVFDDQLSEIEDGDEITLTASSGNSISADITCEVTYSPSGSDGNVTITSAAAAGFDVTTTDNETYTLTFSANGSHVITIAATEDETCAITVTFVVSGLPNVRTVTDVIDNALTGVGTGTTYTDWSDKSDQSDAVYAGRSAGGNTTVQLRTSGSDEGVITTVSSGGVATFIKITFNDNTADSRQVDVYGKNTAYSATSELFGNSQGTLIGSVTYDKNGSGETVYSIDVSSDATKQFSYIGIRSHSSALYLDSIEITWTIEEEIIDTLEYIYIDGSLTTSTYIEGQTISLDGLTVYGHYTTAGNVSLMGKSGLTFGSTPSTATSTSLDEITVNASYEGKNDSETYEISVSADYVTALGWGTRGYESGDYFLAGQTLSTMIDTSKWTFTPTWASGISKTAPSFGTGTDDVHVGLYSSPTPETETATALTNSYTFTTADDGKYLVAFYKGAHSGSNRQLLITESLNSIVKPAEGEPGYFLVKDVNNLSVGDTVVIAAFNYDYAMSSTQGNNNRAGVEITKDSSDSSMTLASGVQTFTLAEGTTSGTWAFSTGSGYIYAASSSNNYLRTETDKSANSSFTVTISNTGQASVVANGSNSHKTMSYNSGNTIFSCYTAIQGSGFVCLYKLSEPMDEPINNLNLKVQHVVVEYANAFNTSLEGICVGIGETDTDDLSSEWSTLSTQFTSWFTNNGKELTSDEKTFAKELFVNASSVDKNVVATADSLQHMLAKYDYIVAHYSAIGCNDFLKTEAGRGAVQVSSGRLIANSLLDNGSATAIIIVTSMIGLSAVGGYFFLRKRKENI